MGHRAERQHASGLFYGPPDTGKTYVATELARHLATSSEHVETVQSHSSYSHQDFIEGLRPEGMQVPADIGVAGGLASVDDVLDAAAASWTARR